MLVGIETFGTLVGDYLRQYNSSEIEVIDENIGKNVGMIYLSIYYMLYYHSNVCNSS